MALQNDNDFAANAHITIDGKLAGRKDTSRNVYTWITLNLSGGSRVE